ncbi:MULTISPECIES: hypothetical protein [Corynebacterium]|uniref:SPOR domain-containing protein n=1 Tax=Corynebacterium provencense TaxID=1737425 RepID=A0A2Z3YTF9_9CORY|nr:MULTISPECIES: hypothetical protein [Corynebacterium]AWT26500.1 hypothetical protein Csp1_17180 [Corynebacterium provencense]MCI1257554.1 SPOR domain-containing protein [Corynebacterium provencense]
MSSDDTGQKWYYDTATGEVTRGKVRGWDTRMGPYDSEDEARSALETARARSEAADDWDRN